MAVNELELRLDAREVALSQLVSAASVFAALLREVAKEYAGMDRDPISWIVDVKPGSVALPVKARPRDESLSEKDVPKIVNAVVTGLRTLDDAPKRPPFFNNKALVEAKALANLVTDEFHIAVNNGQLSAEATKRLMTHVDEVMGNPRDSIGTVEGRLEALDLHSKPRRFAIFDVLTDKRVECFFTSHVTLDDVLRGVGRRVAVTGIIKTRPDGERVSVEARELRVFPAEEELPSPDDVRGILPRSESA
ncbi:MAG: hypothetical protein AUI36_38280 [Cyanobacteria bacterium 13_1_40CM_2_61_4]|nr:MAG: hypothetical protein AUI36_38280 [Cyanobacteria bacterium 13_1_40CM_2_61_4]